MTLFWIMQCSVNTYDEVLFLHVDYLPKTRVCQSKSLKPHFDMALILPLQLMGELLYVILQARHLSCCQVASCLQPPLPILYFC